MQEKKKIYFNVSARTARLIGQENFANAEGAVIELVKNAYDADASFCAIIFDLKDNMHDSSIYIVDGGNGMDDTVIERQWMTIGTDDKLVNSKSSASGRIKSGAKGIGRFALNRLGKTSLMLTAPIGKKKIYEWEVNWTDFEKTGSTLSDVGASLSIINSETFHERLKSFGLLAISAVKDLFHKDDFHGTILKISDLNDLWDKHSLDSLYSSLELLIPAHLASDFTLYMFMLSDLKEFGKVNNSEYEDFDYKVYARYFGKSSRTISVEIERKEFNIPLLETEYKGVFEQPYMKEYPYRLEDFKQSSVKTEIPISNNIDDKTLSKIGCFEFLFYFVKNTIKDDSDLNASKKYPYNPIDSTIRKQWLKKFGGVKIYRDKFRVRPYGEPGNDWLRLGERQSQSPGGAGQKMGGYRIRPNQISGSVFISRIENTSFEDKSSREGIMENDEFILFQNLLKLVIEAFEKDRNTIMYSLSQYYKLLHQNEDKAKKVSDTINRRRDEDRKKQFSDNEKILAEGYSSLENELSEKDAEIRMLRSLASSGIAVASFTHELQSLSKLLLPRTDLLRDAMLQLIPEEDVAKKSKFDNPYYLLQLIRNDDVKLHQWLNYSLNAIRRDKRDRKEILLKDYFNNLKLSWAPSLEQKNIHFDINPNEGEPIFYGYEIDLDSIFNNLITNSVTSLLRTSGNDKKITLKWICQSGFLKVDFMDNGLGLAAEYTQNPQMIFDAFETSSRDKNGNKTGTGMGLFIVKGIIDSYPDAQIYVSPVPKGFCMKIILKLK